MSKQHVASESDLVREGLAASGRGDADRAVEAFRRAVEAQPDSAVPRFLLGAELAQRGDFDGAEAEFANAVLLAPDFDIARFQLGLLQFSSGRPAVALVTWAPLLERDHSTSLQCFATGFALLARDDLSGAMELFRAGRDLPPQNGALNADIDNVMERIQRLLEAADDKADGEMKPDASSDEAPSHILLSNYGWTGQVH